MNKKLVKEFLIITFVIMLIFWGGCALISQIFILTINNIFLRIMHIIGGFSPTIASYISLKRNNKVKNLKEWLKKIFDIKHNIWTYVLVILFVLIYYVLGCAINGFEFGAPIFMLIVILPMMLFGGGNEEVGWRMILQPELEKKFGFHIATIFTFIIWWLWHLPIFFIIGTANANMNYFLFGIMCLTLCYALATIRKVSKGVFPCILTHCLINGLSAIFVFNYSLLSCCITLIVTIIVSITMLIIYFKASKTVQTLNIKRKSSLDNKTIMLHKLYTALAAKKSTIESIKNLFNKDNKTYLKAKYNYNVIIQGIIYLVLGIIELTRYIIIFYAVYLVKIGNIEIGTILLIYSYYDKILTNFEVLGTITADYQSFIVSLKRINKIISLSEEVVK